MKVVVVPPFKPKAGLKQVDPFSPYMFILCMEVLSQNLDRMQMEKRIVGIKVSKSNPKVGHLFFANDIMFCFKATQGMCKEI